MDSFLPHGFCLRWDAPLVLTMIGGNLGIAVAYFSIPIALWYFTKKRADLPYRFLFQFFALFIVSCGLTHVMKVVTLYRPWYWAEAGMDVFTALVSLLTAIVLWPIIPKALSLKSPRELEEVNEELRKVNDELAIARDQALAASELKSAFVANISHELRTPLSGILGMNEILMQSELDEEQSEIASHVQESATTLLSIVNDLLDLSKIEAGKHELVSVKFRPREIINESVVVISPAISAGKLELRCDIQVEDDLFVFGDGLKLKQVLNNLLNNACKYTESGYVKLTARVEPLETESDKPRDEGTLPDKCLGRVKLSICVEDSGICIAESEQEKLFRPFVQIDSSSTRRFGGTGLGLAICKRFVAMMGGQISIQSTEGQGSTFSFWVPFERVEGHAEPETQREGISVIKRSGDKPVLIVEDNPVLQLMATKQLESLGLKTHVVSDGPQALAEIEANEFALVLMDCNLPRLDGFEVTKKVREAEKSTDRHLVIIAMTAGTMKGDEEKCLSAGMDDFISKPYTIEDLRKKLDKWLIDIE